jgi:hypothetical protein
MVYVSLPCHSLAVSQCIMSVRAWQLLVTAMWDLVIPPGDFGDTGGFNNFAPLLPTNKNSIDIFNDSKPAAI